jgi:ankyrin repeat protein
MAQLSPEKRFLYAVEDGNMPDFEQLLSKVDVNTTNAAGAAALHLAVMHNRADMAKQLLKAGANPNALNEEHLTPLHWAATYGNTPLAKLLLDEGAEVNTTDHHGNTALWTALLRPQTNTAFLRLLLDHGANPQLKNKHGKSAYEQAIAMKAVEAQKLMQSHGAA